jgi:orotidine-5'-phosphate decarboxylase
VIRRTPEPFGHRLARAAEERQTVLCIGLDPRPELLPAEVWGGVRRGPAGTARAVERFCAGVLEAAADQAVAVKPQLAFFEALGHPGLAALERLAAEARDRGLLVVLDGKRGDVPTTSAAYADAYLRSHSGPPLGDALTVNPYLGADSLEPFVDAGRDEGGGVFVLVRTTNPAGGDLQELALAGGGRVWEHVAGLVDRLGAASANGALASVGAVMGANQPQVLARARELMPHAPFLLPGIGAQGGVVDDLAPAFAPGPGGGLVSASRALLYPEPDPSRPLPWRDAVRAAAEELRERAWGLAGAAR